jgi:hypothetical protein
MSNISQPEPPPVEQPKLPGSQGKLNVILHGLLSFDQETKEKEEIAVYIPNMGSEHLYKAGNWLAETTLAKGADLKLVGVSKGSTANKLDKDRNMILGDVPVIKNPDTYATLRLPYPSLPIQSLRRLTIPADGLEGNAKATVLRGRDAVQTATVQVLTYPFASDADLMLVANDPNLKPGDHPWEPVLEDGYVNLHVFSEPERNSTEQHLRYEFEASIGLFEGVELTLTQPAQPADLDAEKKEIPPGVHELELEDLVQRQRRLAVLGRAIKESRDLNTIWDDPTPFEGNDSGACSPQPGSDS